MKGKEKGHVVTVECPTMMVYAGHVLQLQTIKG